MPPKTNRNKLKKVKTKASLPEDGVFGDAMSQEPPKKPSKTKKRKRDGDLSSAEHPPKRQDTGVYKEGLFLTPTSDKASALQRHTHTPPNKSREVKKLDFRAVDFGSDHSDGGTSDSSVPRVESCTNHDLIVSVRAGTNNSIIILISNARPDTVLGSKQGEHVSAYRAILEMLVNVCEDRNAKKITSYIADVASAIMPDQKSYFDNLLVLSRSKQETFFSRQARKDLIKDLKKTGDYDAEYIEGLKNSLKANEKFLLMEAIEKIAQEFIIKANLDELIAFKRQGESDKAEGARIKKAVHGLKVMNELANLRDKVTDEHPLILEKRLDVFYDDYIKNGAKYKDGANAVFSSKRIRNVSWQISHQNKQDKLFRLQDEIAEPEKKAAQFFLDLFDFQYDKHKDDDLQLLYQVCAKHLVIMFRAFDKLSDMKDQIIENFLDGVLKSQNWSEHEEGIKKEDLLEGISKYATLEPGNFSMASKKKGIAR